MAIDLKRMSEATGFDQETLAVILGVISPSVERLALALAAEDEKRAWEIFKEVPFWNPPASDASNMLVAFYEERLKEKEFCLSEQLLFKAFLHLYENNFSERCPLVMRKMMAEIKITLSEKLSIPALTPEKVFEFCHDELCKSVFQILYEKGYPAILILVLCDKELNNPEITPKRARELCDVLIRNNSHMTHTGIKARETLDKILCQWIKDHYSSFTPLQDVRNMYDLSLPHSRSRKKLERLLNWGCHDALKKTGLKPADIIAICKLSTGKLKVKIAKQIAPYFEVPEKKHEDLFHMRRFLEEA